MTEKPADETSQPTPPVIDPAIKAQARKNVLLYGAARFLLFIVLTIVIQTTALLIDTPVPIVISAMLALMVAMPLSFFLFPQLRVRAAEAVAQWSAQRKAYKEWIKTELSSR